MKLVTYGERSLLMSNECADALIEYAAALGAEGLAATVSMSAIGPEGEEEFVTFLLNPATTMLVESATSHRILPANDDVVRFMRERTRLLREPPPAQPVAFLEEAGSDDPRFD